MAKKAKGVMHLLPIGGLALMGTSSRPVPRPPRRQRAGQRGAHSVRAVLRGGPPSQPGPDVASDDAASPGLVPTGASLRPLDLTRIRE
jgi:hypothetical protein